MEAKLNIRFLKQSSGRFQNDPQISSQMIVLGVADIKADPFFH